MLSLNMISSLMLPLILLALSYNIETAPTHHLTIGVQGNTPTLMVTSSEIGITAETMGSMKKPDHIEKSHKHFDAKKKWDKIKLTKNQAAFNKKEKLQHLNKPLIKQNSREEEEGNSKTTPATVKSLMKDQEISKTNTEDFITTTITTKPSKLENLKVFTTNKQLTSLAFKEFDNIPLAQETITTTTPQDFLDIKPQTTTLKPKYINIPKIMSANSNPKDLNKILATTVINYEETENPKTPAIAKDFIKTQTETIVVNNYNNDDVVAADNVSQTHNLQDTKTVIKTQNENDNDSSTPDLVATTNNENLLLTSVETKAFTNTPIAITTVDISMESTTHSLSPNTLKEDNTQATTQQQQQQQQILSLSSLTKTTETRMEMPMTTTENIVADNDKKDNNGNQQQQAREYAEIDKTTETYERNRNKENEGKLENHNDFVTLKSNTDYTTKAIVMPQTYGISENSKTTKQNKKEIDIKKEAEIETKTDTQEKKLFASIKPKPDYYTTTTESFLESKTTRKSESNNPSPYKFDELSTKPENYKTTETLQISQESHTTTEAAKTLILSERTPNQADVISLQPETTTEAILKLIDLEQHVLKTIDDLKQPSLLMSGQHDNGHDGLKNIKKKQLEDKHYVEALLHNKQDAHIKDSLENEKYLPLTTPGIETTSVSPITTTSTTNKPLLMPIKHGYLGPILMEEKTFHVIHHPDKSEPNKKHHITDIEAQLRKRHFVELKVKTEVTEGPNVKDIKPINKLEDKDGTEMQSDQPHPEPEKLKQVKEKYNKMEEFKKNLKYEAKFLNKEAKNPSLNNKKEPQLYTTTKEIIEPTEHSPIDLNEDLKTPTENSKLAQVTKQSFMKYTKPQIILNATESIAKETKEDSKSSLELLKSEEVTDKYSMENFKANVNMSTTEKVADKSEFKGETEITTEHFKTEAIKGEKITKPSDLKEQVKISLSNLKSETTSSQENLKQSKLNEENPFATELINLEKTTKLVIKQPTGLTRDPKPVEKSNSKEDHLYATEISNSEKITKLAIEEPSRLKEDAKSSVEISEEDHPYATEMSKLEKTTKLITEEATELKQDAKLSVEKSNLDDDHPYATEISKSGKITKDTKSSVEKSVEIVDENITENFRTETVLTTDKNMQPNTPITPKESKASATIEEFASQTQQQNKSSTVLSSTVFQVIDSVATKTPIVQADTLFTSEDKESQIPVASNPKEQTESKISDIQIEVYDSTIDSIVASTNFKDSENKKHNSGESSLGKTTKPPVAAIQQERFTQYVIDRAETSTHEPINYSTIQVASGKPEPAAIEIHINVSESFGNESEDLEFSYPQSEYNNNNNERIGELLYEDSKVNDNIKLKIPSNSNNNGKDLRTDEILVVEIIDTDNITDAAFKEKSKSSDDLFITDTKDHENTPPPPPPPPPYQNNFDRDSDTIFYISNTEVKVGESLPNSKTDNEERKLKLESQFFPANYIASTHPNVNSREDSNKNHHLYEEDIILSSSRNQADSLKIYRNRNEPSPPLDVTYVGESIIEVEQSPDSGLSTTYAPDQQHNPVTPQADVIIQPAILPEISIGVPVIGELPPQIELKEIDFMPNEAQLHRSGIYDDNDIDDNTINDGSNSHHEADIANGNSNNNINQRVDESSIQYGGDLIDESADGGFDGVEGSYPFGNPSVVGKSSNSPYTSAFMAKLRKQQQQEQQQQPNHVADYAHLYVNYGVNNMRKDELSADVKDSGETMLVGSGGGGGNGNGISSNEQNLTNFKDFLLNNNNKVSMNNSNLLPFMSANLTQNERMSNATAFSVMEDANDLEDKNAEDIINLISLAIGLFIVILPVVVTCSLFWALRYLYIKYHSNLTDNGGYAEQTEIKVPLDEDGVEKGEYVHEPSSSPTNSNKDDIEKYPETSNKPSTTDTSNIKFSTEKSSKQLETSNSNTNTNSATNITMTTNSSSCATTFKKNDSKLSLALSCSLTQEPPLPSASSPSQIVVKRKSSEHIQTVQNDVDNEDGVHDANDDDDDDNDDVVEMPGPNGSITKMTLENNLLIVETEERNDISRVARETKMDYNKDGVFVVEVARGIDSKNIPESPVTEGSEKMLSMFDTKQNNGGIGYKITNEKTSVNNEKVQIHSPPPENPEEGPRSLHQIEEVEEPTNSPQLNENSNEHEGIGLAYKANTGLSQSDLSTTSSNDSNKGYCYGNQELYVVEQSGYSSASPASNVVLKCDVKDVKDDDRNPGNDHYLKHSPDRREENKDKENMVETTKNTQEGNKRTNSGESPAAKPTDKELENTEAIIINENKENLRDKQSEVKESNTNSKSNVRAPELSPNCKIPVEIEVHITPAQLESFKEAEKVEETLNKVNASESLIPAQLESSKVMNTANDITSLPIVEATESITEPLVLETISAEFEEDLAAETFPEIDIPLSMDIEEGVNENNEKIEKAAEVPQICPEIAETKQDSIALDISANHKEQELISSTVAQEVENNEDEEILKKRTDQLLEPDDIEKMDINKKSSTKEIAQTEVTETLMEPTVQLSESSTKEISETEVTETAKEHIYQSSVSHSKNVMEISEETLPATTNVWENMKEEETTEFDNKKEVNSSPISEEISETKESELVLKQKNALDLNEKSPLHSSPTLNKISEIKETEPELSQVNGLELNGKSSVHMNGDAVDAVKQKEIEEIPLEAIEEEQHKLESMNGYIYSDVETLTNGSSTLPDLVTELKLPLLQNGHADVEPISSSLTDMENGYDSIMSLPEPPPTTDEPLISDLSDQQLDSLPPPPPPEIFNLKDLPPPLTNGNVVDSPQSEESNNFYNSLPPPPPTTLDVTATDTTTTATTNGKVHASPLTPPASPPPAHYTNNLHAGLCSQPIAVDVNGS